MDDEASADMKKAMTKYDINYQLAPPHMHLRNAAERYIQTFKNHFLSGLTTTDTDFPISEWDRLLDQAVITFNSVWNYQVNPNLSSYAYKFGKYDFN